MVATERGLRILCKVLEKAQIKGRDVGTMVANLVCRRIPDRGNAIQTPNYLTQIGEIAIMIGFVRRGSRAAKGIRL